MIETFKTWTEAGKNLFALLRDLLLFLVLLALVGCPQGIGDRLRKAGVSSLEGPGFKWQAEVKQAQKDALAAGAAVEQSKAQTEATIKKIDEIVAQKPELAPVVDSLRQQVVQSNRSLDAAGTKLVDSVANQQDLLARAGVVATTLRGWMYLGRVDEAKARWQAQTVGEGWPLRPPVTVAVTDSTYIRGDSTSGAHAAAAPLGVADVGKSVSIESIDYVHLRGGGWAVWGKATVLP